MTILADQSLSHLNGFNYQPSFSLNGTVRWLDRWNGSTVRRELARGRELFPWMRVVRLWLSHDAWMEDRPRFLAHLAAEAAICRELGLSLMPVLFNGWHGMPDYGGLGPMHAKRAGNADNLERIFLAYAADVAASLAATGTLAVWDLCNEPWLHYQDPSPVRDGYLAILAATAQRLRAATPGVPIGVGNWGKAQDDRDVAPFIDVLLTHRYWAHQYMRFEDFVHNLHDTIALANELRKPLIISECTWGRWDDGERAEAMAREIAAIRATGAGCIPYVLWDSPVADCHGKAGGFTYDADAPGDLCFIRRDGTLRPGHDRINHLF
jgi:hypothetical protein